jgi:hypothetical protein
VTYRLTLVPSVKEHPSPKQFAPIDLGIEIWSFQGSVVILNDMDVLGRMNMSGGRCGSIAFVDSPGIAKAEFSLLKLVDAEPIGVLQDGTLRINHGDDRIEISGVRNGIPPTVLEGGPYVVWVRWLPPSQTLEEYRQVHKERLAVLRDKIGSADSSVSPATIARLEQLVESGRVLYLSTGTREPKAGEVEPSDK